MGESTTRIVPAAQFNIPPDAEMLGPTGQIFIHPRGISTQLNIVEEVPGTGGKFSYFPLLVPGQVMIDRLFAGEKPTRTQYAIARSWAANNRDSLPLFDTPEAAVDAEMVRHKRIEAETRHYFPDMIELIEGLFPSEGRK